MSVCGTSYVHAERQSTFHIPTFEFAPDFEVDGLSYKIIDGGVELTRPAGSSETVPTYNLETLVVPETVSHSGNTYPVVRIGEGTFLEDKAIRNITIPEGVVSYGKYSFGYSGIKNVNFPSTLKKIEYMAFWFCENLESIVIPDNVEEIGESAFSACENMRTFTFGRGLASVGMNVVGSYSWLVHDPMGWGMGLEKTAHQQSLPISIAPMTLPRTSLTSQASGQMQEDILIISTSNVALWFPKVAKRNTKSTTAGRYLKKSPKTPLSLPSMILRLTVRVSALRADASWARA